MKNGKYKCEIERSHSDNNNVRLFCSSKIVNSKRTKSGLATRCKLWIYYEWKPNQADKAHFAQDDETVTYRSTSFHFQVESFRHVFRQTVPWIGVHLSGAATTIARVALCYQHNYPTLHGTKLSAFHLWTESSYAFSQLHLPFCCCTFLPAVNR